MSNLKIPTFAEQAEKWLEEGINRKRSPFRPATVKSYKSQIDTILVPFLGKMSLHVVNNKAVKALVQKMVDEGYAPASIDLNVNIIKQIRTSATNEDGEELYPYKWNSEVIDAPVLDRSAQKRPIASAQSVQDSISGLLGLDKPVDACLVALLAGTGLRVAEAQGLVIVRNPSLAVLTHTNYWFPNEAKIVVNGQRDGAVWGPTKTKAGVREIDLSPVLNDFLMRTFSGCDGLMFPRDIGTYAKSFKLFGIQGFHALRRFRITFMQLNGVPESLIKFWVGHEQGGGVTGRYTLVGEEIQKRKSEAERVGLGFGIPNSVQQPRETCVQ